jgi:hypothetical protein
MPQRYEQSQAPQEKNPTEQGRDVAFALLDDTLSLMPDGSLAQFLRTRGGTGAEERKEWEIEEVEKREREIEEVRPARLEERARDLIERGIIRGEDGPAARRLKLELSAKCAVVNRLLDEAEKTHAKVGSMPFNSHLLHVPEAAIAALDGTDVALIEQLREVERKLLFSDVKLSEWDVRDIAEAILPIRTIIEVHTTAYTQENDGGVAARDGKRMLFGRLMVEFLQRVKLNIVGSARISAFDGFMKEGL